MSSHTLRLRAWIQVLALIVLSISACSEETKGVDSDLFDGGFPPYIFTNLPVIDGAYVGTDEELSDFDEVMVRLSPGQANRAVEDELRKLPGEFLSRNEHLLGALMIASAQEEDFPLFLGVAKLSLEICDAEDEILQREDYVLNAEYYFRSLRESDTPSWRQSGGKFHQRD